MLFWCTVHLQAGWCAIRCYALQSVACLVVFPLRSPRVAPHVCSLSKRALYVAGPPCEFLSRHASLSPCICSESSPPSGPCSKRELLKHFLSALLCSATNVVVKEERPWTGFGEIFVCRHLQSRRFINGGGFRVGWFVTSSGR